MLISMAMPYDLSCPTQPLLSMRLVPNERDNHAVEVEEEHNEVEAQLDERLFLVDVQFSEDLGRVQQMLVVHDSTLDLALQINL